MIFSGGEENHEMTTTVGKHDVAEQYCFSLILDVQKLSRKKDIFIFIWLRESREKHLFMSANAFASADGTEKFLELLISQDASDVGKFS